MASGWRCCRSRSDLPGSPVSVIRCATARMTSVMNASAALMASTRSVLDAARRLFDTAVLRHAGPPSAGGRGVFGEQVLAVAHLVVDHFASEVLLLDRPAAGAMQPGGIG